MSELLKRVYYGHYAKVSEREYLEEMLRLYHRLKNKQMGCGGLDDGMRQAIDHSRNLELGFAELYTHSTNHEWKFGEQHLYSTKFI